MTPAPSKKTGHVVGWIERCAWKKTDCSGCAECVVLQQQQLGGGTGCAGCDGKQQGPQQRRQQEHPSRSSSGAHLVAPSSLLLHSQEPTLPHEAATRSPPKNGTCLDVVQRTVAMHVLGVRTLLRCEDLRPEGGQLMGKCNSYVATESSNGMRSLCAEPHRKGEGCRAGPPFLCGGGELLAAKLQLDEMLPL